MKIIKKLTAVFMAVLMLTATVPFFSAFAADGESTENVVLELVKTYQDNDYVTVQVNLVSGYFEAMDFQFIMSDGVTCRSISAYVGVVNPTNGKVSMVSIDGYTAGTLISATFTVPSDDIFTITAQASCNIAVGSNDTQSVNTIINGVITGKKYLNDTVYYTFDKNTGTVTIGGTGDMPDYSSDNRSPFFYNTSIKNVIIEEGITSIGEYVFIWCTNLSNIIIPDSVTSIDNSAFEGCQSLTSVTIPDSVTSIGDYAFKYCFITSITIPDSVISISDSAFRDCSYLTSIKVDENNPVYDSRENCNAIIETATNTLIRGCSNTIIPSTINCIDSYAFYSCSDLTNIAIPDSITNIGDSAFYDCTSLTTITIPDGITSIEDFTFFNCRNLTSITIPDSVIRISEFAFEWCYSLTDVYYNGYKEQWDKIEIDRGNDSLLNANIHFLEPQVQPTGKIEKVYIPDTDVYYKSSGKIVPQISVDDGLKYTVKYESSNPSVAVVDKDGNISTVHKGSTTITCTVTDDYGNTVRDTCTVNVKFRWWQWLIWILLLGFLWY